MNRNALLTIRNWITYHSNAGETDYAKCAMMVKGKVVCDPAEYHGDWGVWQRAIKQAAWINQKGKCICGEILRQGELHHALITRADVQGHSQKYLIHHSYNVVVIHPGDICHGKATRIRCWDYLSDLYSAELIHDWYNGVPFDVKRRTIVGVYD